MDVDDSGLLECARSLLEEYCPGAPAWTEALAQLHRASAVDRIRALVRQIDPSTARRFLTAHAIAAAIRRRDPRTAREASSFLSDLEPLLARANLDVGTTLDLAAAVAEAAETLERLRGHALAEVRRRVWSACFGASLYEAPWHWRDLRDQSVMVLGETGTGKELVAQTIGMANVWFRPTLASGAPSRKPPPGRAPLVAFNVAALATSNAEGELFGWEKGAFTGADNARVGIVEAGHAGTIFMDEIGDMSRDLVAKLLRTIEEHEVIPFGGDATRPRLVCARWVTATSKDIDRAIAEGRFSEDLRRRLSSLEIRMPPLRSWDLEDVRELARAHVTAAGPVESPWTGPHHDQPAAQPSNASTGITSAAYLARITARFDEQLGRWLLEARRAWPGNVRQLLQLVGTWKIQGEAQARDDLDRIPILRAGTDAGRADLPNESALATLHDRVMEGSATLSELKAWYVMYSRRTDESLRAHASRLEIDPKTANSLRADYDAIAEKLR